MMAIDFVTGTACAWSKHNFKSAKMRRGLAKKIGEIAILDFLGNSALMLTEIQQYLKKYGCKDLI